MTSSACGKCKHAHMEKDRHNELQIECRRYPPTLLIAVVWLNFLRSYQLGHVVNIFLDLRTIGNLKTARRGLHSEATGLPVGSFSIIVSAEKSDWTALSLPVLV